MTYYSFWDFFIQILMVNKVEFPQNKIFIILKYWLTPFGIYKHVVKSKMQENNFCIYEIHAKTHFLLNFKYLFILKKKECSKYVKVLVVCNTQKHFYIFIETRAS